MINKIKSLFKRIWKDIKLTFAPENLTWAILSGCAILSVLGVFIGVITLILLG